MSTSSELENDALRVKLEYGAWREEFNRAIAGWMLASNELKSATLLTGKDLVAAESWLLAPDVTFSSIERQFIAKSSMQSSLRRARARGELDEELAENVQRRLRLIFAMAIVIFAILAPGLFNYAVIRAMQDAQEHTDGARQAASIAKQSAPPTRLTVEASAAVVRQRDEERARQAAETEALAAAERMRLLPALALRLAGQGDTRGAILVAIEAGEDALRGGNAGGALSAAKSRPGPSSAVAAYAALVQLMSTSREMPNGGAAVDRTVSAAVFCGAGRRVLAAIHAKPAAPAVTAFDFAGGAAALALGDRPERLQAATFDRSCGRVLLTAPEHYGEIWSLGSGRRIVQLRGHEADIVVAAFSPDGQHIVTGAQEMAARVWDASTGKAVALLRGHEDSVLGAAFSADARRIVTASQDKTARVWDAVTGRIIRVLSGHLGFVTDVAFSPDGERVLTTSHDGTAALWSAAKGERIASMRPEGSTILKASFSRDGLLVGSIGQGHSAHVWDAKSGLLIAELGGHASPVRQLAFSDNGRWVVTATWSGEARVWDAKGRPVAVVNSSGAGLQAVDFSIDGQNVVAIDETGKLLTWPVLNSLDDALAHAKRLASPCLTAEERRAAGLWGDVPGWCGEHDRTKLKSAHLQGLR